MPRYTVNEAAEILGVGSEAIRKRISRGSLRSEIEDGTRFVWLDDDPTAGHIKGHTIESTTLISRLEDEVEFLRQELERRDHLLAAALERIPPQLEAPQEPSDVPGSSRTAMEPTPNTATAPEAERAPWWKRWFGA